jgi:hypothetical protein
MRCTTATVGKPAQAPTRLGLVQRLILWTGTDAERWEVVQLELSDDGVQATGTQVGVDPEPLPVGLRT